MATDPEPAIPGPAPGSGIVLHWRSLSDGLLLSFLVSAPTVFLALVERDQHNKSWYPLLAVAGLGLLIGGAIAGRHRRSLRGASLQGFVLGVFVVTIALVANIAREFAINRDPTHHTELLWVAIEVGGVLLSTLAALIGRRLYYTSGRRRSPP